MEQLILARHAESEYSVRGLVNGDITAVVALTEEGRAQAERLGRALAGEELDLCVVTPFRRTRETAELALRGRSVPIEEEPGLSDPRAGTFEGVHLDEYRRWAWTTGSREEAPGGGESRIAAVTRYAAAYRRLLGHSERTILAVLHALPIAYVLAAREGQPPAARMDRPVEYASPYRLSPLELAAAVELLESWCAAPSW